MRAYFVTDTKRPGVKPEHYININVEPDDDLDELLGEIMDQFPNAQMPRSPITGLPLYLTLRTGHHQLNIRGLTANQLMVFKLKWGLTTVTF